MSDGLNGADVELLLADGSAYIGAMLPTRYDDKGNPQPKAWPTQLSALVDGVPLGRQLHAKVQQTFFGGIGVSYNWAPGVYTRTDGYALPAGAVTQSAVQSRSVGEGVAFAEYGGDLWIATNEITGGSAGTGKVNRNVGGVATGSSAFATSLTLGSGEYVRDLLVADDGSGTSVLFASSSDVDGVNGRMHKWDGASWTSTAAASPGPPEFGAGNGRNRLAKVFWRGRDGVGAWRIVSISRRNGIVYTVPGGDPMTAAGWVEPSGEPAFTVDTAYSLDQLVAFRQHVFVTARDNLYDLTETGDSPGLTSYLPRMIQAGTGVAAEGLDDYVYMSVGRGIERVYVGTAGQLQSTPGQCAPGWLTRAENEVRGFCTAMCVDQGYLVAAIHNQTSRRTYVCWGKGRDAVRTVETASPMVWWGPELVLGSDYKITRMHTSGLANAGSITNDLRLWCTATSATTTALLVFWMSLPVAGSPVQDLVSNGPHRFGTGSAVATVLQPFCFLETLPEQNDEATQYIVDQHSFATRGLSVVTQSDGSTVDDGLGTKLTIQTMADPAPGVITYPSGTDVTTTPLQTIVPASTVKGSSIWRKITWTSPNGTSSPPKIGILDACRVDFWKVAPNALRLELTVRYGDVALWVDNQEVNRDPDTTTADIKTLTERGRTTLKLPDGRRYTVKIVQDSLAIEEKKTANGVYGKVVTARFDALILGAA